MECLDPTNYSWYIAWMETVDTPTVQQVFLKSGWDRFVMDTAEAVREQLLATRWLTHE